MHIGPILLAFTAYISVGTDSVDRKTFANARKSSKSEFQILKFKKLPGCRFCAQSRSTKAIGRSETFRSKILIAKLEQVFTSFYTSSIKFKFRGLGGWFMDCKMSEDAV